jgi:hypothetical protein
MPLRNEYGDARRDLEAKLNVRSNAGFSAIDWWAKDLAAHTGSRGSEPRGEELKRELQA